MDAWQCVSKFMKWSTQTKKIDIEGLKKQQIKKAQKKFQKNNGQLKKGSNSKIKNKK